MERMVKQNDRKEFVKNRLHFSFMRRKRNLVGSYYQLKSYICFLWAHLSTWKLHVQAY